MAWLERLDVRIAKLSPLWQGLYLLVKWTLVGLGAFGLAGWYLERMGWWNPYG